MSDASARSAPPKAIAARARQRRALMAERAKTHRTLITPEGARIPLKIATAGERAGAFVIDFVIFAVILVAGIFLISSTANAMGWRGMRTGAALIGLFVFILRNFYFVFFEVGRRAATPGKRALGLRVASRGGGRLTADAVFARNFMREVEFFLPLQLLLMASAGYSTAVTTLALIWSLMFLLIPIFNKDKLRAGDIIAGTWVIHAPKSELQGDIATATPSAIETGFIFTPQQLDAYGIHELHVLENVLRKGSDQIRRNVADRIRRKIEWDKTPGEKDRAFLDAYYASLRRHLEQKMLFGQRKADKFDTR